MHRITRINANYLLVILFSFLLFSCQSISIKQSIEQPKNLTLIAAGDNLFHITIINSHKQEDGSFNFDPIYAPVKDLIQNADLAFINQETVMGGSHLGYSGFPRFNSPQSLAYTLRDTGFDIINIANNHSMDMGPEGLYNTLDLLADISEFTVIGARKEKEGINYRIVTKNNISLGFLSYTFDLNGLPLPKDNPNAVSLTNRTKMAQEMKELRPLCDFLIVSIHWGDEYRLIEPNAFQINTAKFIAEHNVDLIIGHHPHVLQKAESLPRPDGKQTICYYSLGNFVSNQNRTDRVFGGMIIVTFTKDNTDLQSETYISDHGLLPIVTHIEEGFKKTVVYPYYDYTEEQLKKHFLYTRDNLSFKYIDGVLERLNTKIIQRNPFTE